ncbi:hydrogenase subunit MbhD domain-containing protein [Candidatus Bipolaricaulota sp. J31]
MIVALLSALALALAVVALTRRRLLWGVAVLGVHSLVLAAVYFSLAAPDVALTEAAIGFGLVTFVYLLAIRRTGKIVVAAVECPPLLYPVGEGASGLLWELLRLLSTRTHRELELRWVERDEVRGLLSSSEADLAAGDILPASGEQFPRVDVLPTRILLVRRDAGPVGAVRGSREAELLPAGGRTFTRRGTLLAALERGELGGVVVNLLELRALYLGGKLRDAEVEPLENVDFAVLFAPDEEELARTLKEIVEELRAGDEWDELVRRYL